MIDNNNGTVTDETTGLMWKQETSEKTMTWEQAIYYCKNLGQCGFTDWRLPTIQELLSIVDYNQYEPAINTTYFPNTSASWYWSSTTDACSTYYAWGVYFGVGSDYYGYKGDSYYVRAVRNILEV